MYRLGGIDDLKPGDRCFLDIRFPEPITPDMRLSTLLQTRATEPWSKPEDLKKQHRPLPFDIGIYNGKELPVDGISNFIALVNYGPGLNHIPLYGRIVNKIGTVITVKISQDEVKEMWGYRFWKELETGASRSIPPATLQAGGSAEPAFASIYSQVVKRWGDGTEADRTYKFQVDGATDVYRNGLVAEPGELVVGDYVFVEYERWWEDQQMFRETIAPTRVQSSSPIP